MQPIPFIAASAEEAVAQIRAQLGPEAVVLHVRPLPANGLARLWQKPMIEVLAHVPEPPVPGEPPVSETMAEFRQQLEEIKLHFDSRSEGKSDHATAGPGPDQPGDGDELRGGHWRVGAILQRTGLQPLRAQFILDQLRAKHGEIPPSLLGDEIALARVQLAGLWRKARPLTPNSLHVLVGPAGSGKTTCLCKWLTQAALVEGRRARVWRLDGATANMAESLSVYCEILGVPGERVWQGGAQTMAEDIGFIDLPGVDWRNPLAIKELEGQLNQFGRPRVHLVLNGAYDVAVLLAQTRAFASLPIEDIIVSHLDEELRWGKIWNLALGTNYSIRYLSTGQNIPGDFREASADEILDSQFPRK
jgi:flagellar biosynthesis protein FlhF